jgi:hypothetical protein
MPEVKAAGDVEIIALGGQPMIGSPSGEIGIGPLITVRMPISFRIGRRSAAGSMKASSRSWLAWKSSRPKSNGTPLLPKVGVPCSQPPMASAPGSGFK